MEVRDVPNSGLMEFDIGISISQLTEQRPCYHFLCIWCAEQLKWALHQKS